MKCLRFLADLGPSLSWTAGIQDKLDVEPDDFYVVIDGDALVGTVDTGEVITLQPQW